MKIFNYFSKLIVISILSILSFNSFGQKIVMDSVSFPSPQIVCNTDTVSFFFKTGIDTSVTPNLPYSNTDIHVDLPDGFKFVDIVYTESIDISKVPAVNINSSNPDDLVFSFNGFMLNPYSTLFELKIVVEPSCGANASTSSAFVTRGGTTNAVSDTITTTLVQVDEPYLVFQGLSNTTNSNASINLSRLAIGQKFMRCFKVDYTSLISSLGEITVKIANDNNYYSFDWVTPGVTKTIVNDTVIYKFDAAFFTTIGNANGVIEPGESFTFCDSVTVLGNCNSQNSNIKVDYVMSWGCGGFNCQNTSIAAEGIISLSSTKISTTARPDLDVKPNLCDTCGSGLVKYGFQFVNNTSAILPTGGFLTNLKFELGAARWPFSIASRPILDSINHCFDSVKINGVTVPFTIGANASVEVANLTSFTGIGLADIDGDGIFDDLATGDTLVFELFGTFYANKHDTSALSYNLNGGNTDAQPYLIDAARGGLDVTYYDECGGNEKEVRVTSDLYNYLNPTNSSSTITPDFFDRGSYSLNMAAGEYNRTTGYDCDSAIRQMIVVLPKDVSLDTTKAYPFSNYPSNSTDSVVFWVEKDGPNDVDTLYIYYSTKGENQGGSSRNSFVILRYDCSGGLCPEADSLRTIFWYQNYICINDAAAECYKTTMFRGKRLVRFHCDLPPQGLSLRTFNIERTTFGYTDSTETTKVNRNTPGIALRKAQVADTVEVTLKGVINNATLDSAHARFSYHTQQFQGGTKPVFRIDDINSRVTIYDASTATHHTFRLNAPGLFSGEYGPQRVGVTQNYDFQWNLSTYKDSIGGSYQFTGANTTASTWDSIIMDIVMIVEDNSYAGDFQIDPFAQMIEFPEDTATQCDIYGGLFSIDQNAINVFARASNSFGSCSSRANVIEFKTNVQDNYPNEYKRNEKINEIRYSWNPTYFGDPDSVTYTYYWRDSLGNNLYGNTFVDRRAQFMQTGNSVVIPMEKSMNINVLPESWRKGYIKIYQTATCAIKDSMPIAQLGVKAEMDVERFTNSSTTTIITQYDSTFSYYGNASANILDIPTPFNITASPIVASTTSDAVCWDITYNNLSFTNINNTWLDFSSDSIQITSIVRIDSGLSIPQTLLSYGTNGLWIQSDTINSTDFKTYRVCAQYSTCKLDSIVLTGGWNCDKYPTDPTSGYAPTAYSCEHNQQTMSVYIEELEAKLQVNIVNSSPMPFNLCDTLFYDVQMANIDLTDLKNLVFSAKFPSTSNLSIYPGSTKLIWAYDGVNTTEIALTDPVRIGDSLAWDLTGQFSSSSLRNFEILNDSNYALIKVRFNTNCVMFPNDAIKFQVQGTRGCDKLVVSKEATSTPFQVNGLLPKVNRLTDIQIYLDTIQACDTASKVDLSFFNIFTKSTRGSEVLAVKLPASFDISGGIYGAHRDSLLQSLVPTNTVTGGVRTLEWFVKAGMPTAGPTGIPGADSLSFSFSIVPITEVTCSIDTLIEAKVFERYFIYCVTDSSVPCEIVYPLDEDRTGFTVTKGDLSLNNISTILDGCTDSLDINFGFTNNGTTIAPGTTTKFKLYVDVNGNGIVDATDPIFDSIIYTDSIPGGSSGTINHKALASNYAAGEICNLIVMIDSSSSCICDSSSASLPVELNMNLTDSILCDIDTLNLGVCAGTGNYAARTYTWYDVDGMGRQIYLSNVNALSPTFNPPTVTVNTTFRFAVQVNRGGCTNEDTISIEVKASPLPFDVMDDTICESDCITLAAASPQAGITYNVYDGLGSWLGTLPYYACPTSTSTYYFEAIDSALGCGAVIDTAIVTVISKMSPGVSSTIAGCGIGCTINLFDTLGGTPDTTGTWTDPSGNPFGTGYNVTFNANSDPVGVYTYTISNMPCADTMAAVTVLAVTDTVPIITNEDTPITVGAPSIGGAGPISTITTSNGPDYGTIVIDTTATGVPTGTITYVPDTNYVGFDTVSVIVCYTAGNCDTTVLTITVLPVMDTTPVIILEDSSFVLCPGTDSTTTVRNFGTVSILCGPMHGDTVVDPITGCVTYEADSNYVGQDTLCIVICDTVAGMCDTTLVPITIVPVRDTVLETIPEGDTLTLCPPSITVVDVLGSMDSLCPPMHGTMILDTTTGCVTYVPDTNFSGVDTLCFVKCDTAGVCDTTTVIISVDPVTDTIPLITNEDVPVSVGQPILSGVSPVDTVSYLNGPDYGTIVIDTTATGVPTGTITYVPDTNYVGFDTVTVVTCNATGICDTTVVLITVLPVMDTTPVVILEDSSFVLCPGTDSTTTVRNFGTVSILCGPIHGDTVVDPITGCVTYEADSNYVGQDTLCIVICDTVAGMCDTTLVPITIVPVRDTVLETIPEGDTLTLCPPSITVVDVLGSMDSLCPPMHGTMILDTTTGCVTYVPDTNFSGVDTLCFVKCDTAGVCDTTTVIISVDPVTDTIPLITNEDVPVSVGQPILSGVSPVDTVSYLNGPDYGTIVIDTTATGVPTGTITYVPDTNYVGFDTVTVVTCDDLGNCDTTIVLITVLPVMDTTPVVILEDSSFVLCPGTDSTTTVRNFGTVSILCGPMHGDTVVDPITGCVTYEADSNYVGQDTLCIVICDTVAGMCDTTLVPITIVPVRDTVLDTISEGDTLTLCPPSITVVDVLGSMDSLCPPMHGTMILDTTTGCVTYVPDTNFSGVDTLCFVKCDTAGVCDTTTVIISVDPVTDTIPLITNEDVPVSVGQPILSGVSPVDTVSYLNGPDYGTIVIDTTATGVPTGTITYVPDTNYIGLDTVTVVTCNATGICDTTVVLITVLPVMDTTPVVILEDSSFVLCPGTDSTTTVRNFGTVSILCGPIHGDTVVDPITGCVTYEADSNYVGQDTLCIVICDTVAGMCDTTLVPITIVPVRDTVLETIPEGDTLTLCPPSITVVDVLGSMDSLCPPMHGTMILDTTTGCVTYVPDTNFSGVDTLCFVKCDTAGVCDTTTVIISVDPVTDTIPLITNEDVPVSVGQPILSGVSPVDTVSYLNGPDYGTIVIDTTATGVPTGTITYVPDTNYVGFDTVTVVTCDDLGNCDTTIVLITVLPVMDTTPVVILEDSSFVLCPGTDSTTTVRNFGTVSILCGPMHGDTVVDPITGCVTYEADSNYVGQDTLCIVICDTVAGMCDTTLVPITIVPVRDTVLDTISEGDTLTLCPPSITVVDVLGSMDSLCPPMHGTMILDTTTGCVTYVPDTNFSGVDTLCFVKCDTAGVCDTTTVIISVDPVTDTIPLITNEDVPVSVGQPILSGVSPVDTVSYLNGPDYGTIVIDTTATGVPTGTITYVPDTNYIGLDTVTVVTCNATGICDTTVVLITVLPVKDTLPIVMPEDSTYELCPNGLLTNVSNLGTTTIICGPNHGTRTVIDPTTGCITYAPDSSYVGVDTLCIVICDTVVGSCDTTFVPITIVPVIDTIIKYINEDDSVTLCVPEMTDVDSLLSIDTLCGPMNGRVTLDTISGCVTYYSDTNFVGFDTVCVVKCDINNVCDTTIIIIVTGPVFDTIHKITNEDVPFTICPPELSNLGSIITSITTYCGPNHGSFDSVIATGCITYTPDTNFVGVDTLCIVSCDTAGNCDTTIVTITVVPVRDTVPLIVNEDDSITLCPRTDSTTDVDILSTVVVNCGPNFGKTRVDPITGCVTYIPDTNFVGVDTICIIVTDTNGVSDTTTYPITIVPVRDTLYDTLSTTTSITLCMPTTTKVDSLGGVSVLCPPTYADSVIVDSITGCVTYVRDSSYAGNDTMCIVICDTAGVCDTTTVIITVNRIFAPFDVMNDTICEGDCITLVSDTMQPGVIYRVHSPVGTIIGRLSTPTVVCPTTDSTFYIEAWDTITGVTSIWDTMTIFVTPFKSPGVSRSIVLCETGNIINLYDSLGGTPDTTGTWVDPLSVPFGTGYLGSYNPLTDTAGVYTYTIVNPVCPDTSATITITKSVAPNPGMFDSISLCQSGTTNDLLNNLLGTPDAGGTWSGPVATTNGDLGTLDPSIGIPARGNYVYTVTKIGCADDSSYVNVWIDTIEDASIRMDETSLCKGLESAQVYVTGATGGTFSTSAVPADNLSIDPVTGLLTFSNRLPFETRSGTYEVYYTTSGPCPETDTITINMTVYGDGCQIEIPQFISPNGDGKNDVLHIPGVEEFPNNVLKIFNRWGNVVYEKQAYDNSWNGSANVDRGINQLLGNGAKLPVGTYFYIFESGDERYPSFAGYVYVK